ncbi:ribonuclease HII [Gelidibacter sp.]|uniref:ribonuclease HII n=1 Tax=Gelidibacter sp. TaxID=2018083 RepID=UPI0032651D03
MKLKLSFTLNPLECGTDEAGRGCLAGPVTAAAVILPQAFENSILNDSKQLSETKRDFLKPIIEQEAISFAFAHIYPEEIDEINILNASILAMHHSIAKLKTAPTFISVDGNKFKPFSNTPHETIIKGDSKYLNIAAASILAKTYRDAYMCLIHEEFPMYNWKKNKGYPTKEHREAIKKYGVTKYHRKTFRLLPQPPQLVL